MGDRLKVSGHHLKGLVGTSSTAVKENNRDSSQSSPQIHPRSLIPSLGQGEESKWRTQGRRVPAHFESPPSPDPTLRPQALLGSPESTPAPSAFLSLEPGKRKLTFTEFLVLTMHSLCHLILRAALQDRSSPSWDFIWR